MSGAPDDQVRVLYVRTEGRASASRDERRAAESMGIAPRRVLVEEAFGFDLLGESTIAVLPGVRGKVLRLLPTFIALALEVSRRRRDYDVVVSWSEKYTVGIAGVLAWRRRRPRHLAIMDWVSKPVVRYPLRFARSGVDRVLTWSSVQGEAAVDLIGFAPEQVQYIEHPVDDVFFSPDAVPRSIVFSAGETQRDFPTLIQAVDGLAVPTLIAASLIGSFRGVRTRLVDAGKQLESPPGVTVRPLTPLELRAAYATARAVVVPLVQADNNAGISVILEAMAMGRPVIATSTTAQVDVIRDGQNGLYVGPGDAAALREKLEWVLAHEEAAEALGRRGRQDVLERHRADDFAVAVRAAATELGQSTREKTLK